MISPKDFDGKQGIVLTPYTFSDEEIFKATNYLPDWLPSEFKQFFKEFGDFKVPGFTLFSPLYDPREFYFINTGYQRFQEATPPLVRDPQNWIPIGYYNGFAYTVYHRLASGEIEVGSYDFESQSYFNGPFATFEDWIISYLN